MGRKCSQCGNMGHNSRTCTTQLITNNIMKAAGVGGGGLRLFGVQLDLSSSSSSSSSSSFSPPLMALRKNVKSCLSSSSSISSRFNSFEYENSGKMSKGYLCDGLTPILVQEKKKGVPWSEEEHQVFLIGLQKMGKGDWRGISRHFVTTRTATQIASHAQKYFLRQNTFNKKKRHPSLFDVGRDKRSVQLIKNPNISRPNYEAASSTIIPCGCTCKAKTISTPVNLGVHCKWDTKKVGSVGDETEIERLAVSHRSKALTLGFNEMFDSSYDQATISITAAASTLPAADHPTALDPSAAAQADLELELSGCGFDALGTD